MFKVASLDLPSCLALMLQLAGVFPYVRSMKKGENDAKWVSLVIWGALDVITLYGMIQARTVNGQVIGGVFTALIGVVYALRYGSRGMAWWDPLCLLGAIIGLAVYRQTQDAMMLLKISLSITLIGGIPTFLEAWKTPDKQCPEAWVCFGASAIPLFATQPAFSFAATAQVFTFTAINVTMLLIILLRPRIRLWQHERLLARVATRSELEEY